MLKETKTNHKSVPPIVRKIQRTGTVSLSITLPKTWIKNHNLKQGQSVLLSISEKGDLIIHTPRPLEPEREEKTKILSLQEMEAEQLEQSLVSTYLKGYKIIRIKSSLPITAQMLRKIERSVENFIGLEIVENTMHEVIIHDISQPPVEDMNRFIKRMNKIVLEMLHEVISGFISKQPDLLADVIRQEHSVDKLYYMLSRQLRGILQDLTVPDTLEFSLSNIIDVERIVKRLEGLADHCNRLANIVLADTELKIPIVPKDFQETASVLEELFRDSMRAFFLKDASLASVLIAKSHEKRSWVWQQILTFKFEENLAVLYNFLRLLERVANYIADIGEATINVYS